MMLRKPELYLKAVTLRSKGLSYNEILEFVPVGKGTISRWCKGIKLTKEQRGRLIQKKRNTPLIKQLCEQAAKSKKEAKAWTGKQIDKLSRVDRDKLLFVSGILLYWAEGAKREKDVLFTNTDPEMIKLVMEFFRKTLRVPEDKFRIKVRIGSEGNLERAQRYWSKVTRVPRENFQRPEILMLNKNSKSLERHPHGMCRITICDISLSRKLLFAIKEFSKKFCPRSSNRIEQGTPNA